MLEMNKVMLIGNLTRDPELSYTSGGTALAKMGLAVNRRWKDRNSGQYQEETTFVDLDAWGNQAEFCSRYLKKGRRVYIEGRLRFNSWETKEGQKRSKLSVTAERVQFADPPRSGGDYEGSSQGGTSQGGSARAESTPQTNNQPASSAPANYDDGPETDNTTDDLPF